VRLVLAAGIACLPLPLQHDAGMTCGFRFEGAPDGFGHGWALGYAADLGCWNNDLAEALANVDVLALEFNHDEHLEKNSGRAEVLIRRVMGDHGHLSNDQAAQLVSAVLARSTRGRLRHLVQLHLSRQCNRPSLARSAVRLIQRDHGHDFQLQTAQEDSPGTWMSLGTPGRIRRRVLVKPVTVQDHQPLLPGWEA
jgi:phosphoribosyl 1,2-cyclic phosphodiesterase